MPNRTSRRAVRPVLDVLESRTLFATVVGLTTTDQLVTFDTATPGTVSTPVGVTGLGSSETLVGIDFRPATGQLFGLGSTGQLYTINRTSGAATAVGSTPTTLTGTNFGVDFNPAVDRLRVVSEADQNLRFVPGTGAAATVDTSLAYATGDANAAANPNVAAVAYTNNTASAPSTTLFGIDTTLNALVTQGSAAGVTPAVSPNTGQLFTVGALGVDVGDVGGFDVAEADGTAYAAFVPAGGATASTFYTVNLTTGALTAVAPVGTAAALKDVSVLPAQRALFALNTAGTAIARINLGALGTNPTLTNVTGLASGDTLTSIDFRPATGQLVGATAAGKLYTINPSTGAAAALGTGFTPTLGGSVTEIDFNPTVDRIRVLTSDDTNARANPDTGALVDADTAAAGQQNDTALDYDTADAGTGTDPDVVAAAYTNSVQGATATTLYALDAARNTLVRIGSLEGAGTTVSPNTGRLFTVGELATGLDLTSGGLDIADDGPAYALINAAGGTGTQLHTINLTTGAATQVATIGDGTLTFADVAVGNAVLTLSPATQTVAEGAGNVTITVNRGGVAEGAATVGFDLVAPTGSGVTAATAGTDFGTAGQSTFTGTVTFADGETSKTITVPLINDTTDEPDETLIVTLANGSGATLGSTIQSTVVITDNDEAVAPASVTVATDPVRTTGKAIQVITVNGTAGDDTILVQQSGRDVVVTLNGAALGTPTPVKGLYRVVVYGGAGDDEIRLNSRLKFSGELHGQGGDDLIVGSKGRDLLVGGEGTDALFGRGGDDILIGGSSDYTADPIATATLLNVFLAKGSFDTRANAVSTGAGINNFVFSTNTIDNDDDRDYLAGEGKTDLFIRQTGDAISDEGAPGVVRDV